MQFWSAEMEKQVAERVQLVLTDPQLRGIFEQFGGEHFRRSSVFHGLAKSLQGWGVRGKRCFEIGTWNGLTAVVLARFFDEVVTVDIAKQPMKHRILSHLGVRNVRCVEMKDNAQKA